DQALLGDLGAEIPVLGAVGSDDGQRDMVPDARYGLRREKVAAGGLEEFQHRLVFERGRIGEVDHHLRAGQGLDEPLAGHRVDARVWRSRNALVTLLLQLRDALGADQAGSADNDDLHGLTSLTGLFGIMLQPNKRSVLPGAR